jgi:hypothetical protein
MRKNARAQEFERLSVSAQQERTRNLEAFHEKRNQEAADYWFYMLLYIGVLVRVLGIVEFDSEKNGVTNLKVQDLLYVIRCIAGSMFAMSRGLPPKITLELCLANDQKGVGLCRIIMKDMLNQYIGDGTMLDAIDVSEILKVVDDPTRIAEPVSSTEHRDVIGLSELKLPRGDILDSGEEDILRESLELMYSLTPAEQIHQAVSKVITCQCSANRYEKREFPFDGDPLGEKDEWTTGGCDRIAEVLKPILRHVAGMRICHLCDGEYKVNPNMRGLRDKWLGFKLTKEALKYIVDDTGQVPTFEGTCSSGRSKLTLKLKPVGVTAKHRYARRAFEKSASSGTKPG